MFDRDLSRVEGKSGSSTELTRSTKYKFTKNRGFNGLFLFGKYSLLDWGPSGLYNSVYSVFTSHLQTIAHLLSL